MGRKPAITRDEFEKVKQTSKDVPKRAKETLVQYVSRINMYTGTRQISEKTLSRILRSDTHEDYVNIIKKDNQHKDRKHQEPTKEPESMHEQELVESCNNYGFVVAALKEIIVRISRIETKLNCSEVKILAFPGEDNLHDWRDVHKEIKDKKEAM